MDVARGARGRAKCHATTTTVDPSPAERACQMVILAIRGFEAGLDRDDQGAMGFAGDEARVLRIKGIGFHLVPETGWQGGEAGDASA